MGHSVDRCFSKSLRQFSMKIPSLNLHLLTVLTRRADRMRSVGGEGQRLPTQVAVPDASRVQPQLAVRAIGGRCGSHSMLRVLQRIKSWIAGVCSQIYGKERNVVLYIQVDRRRAKVNPSTTDRFH